MNLVVRMGVVIIVAASLAACTTTPPTPSPTPQPSSSASEPSALPSDEPTPAPTLKPAGTASDNLPYFDSVNEAFLASDATPGGRAIIDNLVAAGFDKSLMQITPDKTAIGRDVDSVQFSVRFGEECLIGQSDDSGYAGTVGPAVAGGACLLGITRAIDW